MSALKEILPRVSLIRDYSRDLHAVAYQVKPRFRLENNANALVKVKLK